MLASARGVPSSVRSLTLTRACTIVLGFACGIVLTSASPFSADHGDHDPELDDDFKGCPEGIPCFEPGLEAAGEHFTLRLIAAEPAEPERHRNDWTVEVRSADGELAPDAEITRGQTFMPVHGHDGRVQPKMTALSEPGQFEVDGLNFTMRGDSEIGGPRP